MSRKRVLVVAAVIRGHDGRVLLARRPHGVHQGGLWEFPGGKVEPGEPEPVALVRELHEELGITATCYQPLIRIAHDYPDKSVTLSVWQVDAFTGADAVSGDVGREGQTIRWWPLQDLVTLDFPAANVPIVAAARLPALWRITPALPDAAAVRAWALSCLRQSADSAFADQGWLLRLPGWPDADYLPLAGELVALAATRNIPVMLHGDPRRLQHCPAAAGVHLPAAVAAASDSALLQRPRRNHWLSMAAHNPDELALASRLGMDFAALSPVLPTSSHPDAPGLGWDTWTDWVAPATLPVYALGGLRPADVARARESGGQGVMGISGFA